jgi:hypothetical protein
VNKANQMVWLIRRSLKHLNYCTFCVLFKSLVKPHLEYANSVWSTYKKKDIDALENLQRRATKMLPDLPHLSYEERLRKLKLPTLKYRRLRGDMIEAYMITTGKYDTRVTWQVMEIVPSSTARGHHLKILKKRTNLDTRKYFFTNRIVDTSKCNQCFWKQIGQALG